MLRRVGLVATAFLTAVALVLPLGASPRGALAAADTTSYSATLSYYDDVQLTYTLTYPNENVWEGSADVPIGGTEAADQIYCIDPFVAFHSRADNSYWDKTTGSTIDEKGDYVSAAPWNLSPAVYKNLPAVEWLILNGYRGDYLANDTVSQASVARLNQLFPTLGTIDKQIAFMATKVALWKILIGDDVVVERTSLGSDFTTGKAKIFADLVQALVDSATSQSADSSEITRLGLTLSYNPGGEQLVSDTSYQFYGPLTASVTLANPADPQYELDLAALALTVSGPSTNGVTAVNAAKIPLPGDTTVPGTATPAQALDPADGSVSNGVWTSAPFYLRIPASRGDTAGLTVQGYAMAKNVPLIEGTPLFFINQQPDGTQSWDAVQAFAGAANSGMAVSLYAQAGINTADVQLGQLYIAKKVLGGTPRDNAEQFTFQILYTEHPGDGQFEPLDLSAYPVHGAASVDLAGNSFTLASDGLAMVNYLPTTYQFEVTELSSAGFSQQYEINIAAPDLSRVAGRNSGDHSANFMMDDDSDLGMVTFYNSRTETPAETARLYVEKLAMDGTELVMGVPYSFAIEQSTDQGASWQALALTADNFLSDPGEILDAAAGLFQLETHESAVFAVDPNLLYRVQELDVPASVTPMYLLLHYADNTKLATQYDRSSARSNLDNQTAWVQSNYTVDDISLSKDGYSRLLFVNQGLSVADLTIAKTVEASDAPPDTLFSFTVYCLSDKLNQPQYPWAVPLTTQATPTNGTFTVGGVVSGRIGDDTNGQPTVLNLKNGEQATIFGLPQGRYQVVELTSDGYAVTYTVGAESSQVAINGETGPFDLTGDVLLRFTNTDGTDEPNESTTPAGSTTPAETTDTPTDKTTGPTDKPSESTTGPTDKPSDETTGPTDKPSDETTGPTDKPSQSTTGPTDKPSDDTTGPTDKPSGTTTTPGDTTTGPSDTPTGPSGTQSVPSDTPSGPGHTPGQPGDSPTHQIETGATLAPSHNWNWLVICLIALGSALVITRRVLVPSPLIQSGRRPEPDSTDDRKVDDR